MLSDSDTDDAQALREEEDQNYQTKIDPKINEARPLVILIHQCTDLT